MSIASSQQKESAEKPSGPAQLVSAPDDSLRWHKDSSLAFYTCDTEGYIRYYNQAAIDLWGRVPEIGKDLWCGSWKIFYPDGTNMPLEECPMAKTLKKGVAHENQRITIERPDGSQRHLLVFPRPLFDDEGRRSGAQNTLVDISNHINTEVRNNTLSAIVESSDDAIIGKDLNGIITSWNSGAERIFKYTQEEIIGKPITLLIPDARLEDEKLILETIISGRRVDHFETVRKDKFGKEVPLSLTVSPIKDHRGKIVGASKVARDISERLQGEERQGVLSAIVESSDDAIISKDLNGHILSWNRGAEKIFGYKEDEVIGKSITILIPEERMEEETHILQKIRSGEKLDHFETIRMTKEGRKIAISLTVSPLIHGRGEIVGASKIARDISNQVKAQAEIKKYARNLEILNSVGKSISENMEAEGILQRVTDATTNLTGAAFGAFFYKVTKEDEDAMMLFSLSGAPREAFEKFGMPGDTAVFHPTFAGAGVVRVDDITKDERYGKSAPHFGMPKGHLPVVSYMAVPVVSTSGEVIGGLFFGHPEKGVFKAEHEDLVVNIATQAAISLDNSRLFEKVQLLNEKKDEFIALASHELRTPLTTISGYMQMLAEQPQDEMSKLFLEKSLKQVNKLNTLVEDMLHMSRIEAGKLEFALEVFDIRQVLLDMAETFSYSHESHRLICDLGDAPVNIEGDKQRIEQALSNIINNAVKYSPGADKVYLKLVATEKDINIRVQDEGIGLTQAQQQELFARFYRAENTKGIAGLGLGLYLTKQIIDRHKGDIKVQSTPGEGSEFTISLPLWQTARQSSLLK